MKREESTNATLGVVENRMRTVDFEPVDDVERCGRNGPVERLMDLEEEGNVAVALDITEKKRNVRRR